MHPVLVPIICLLAAIICHVSHGLDTNSHESVLHNYSLSDLACLLIFWRHVIPGILEAKFYEEYYKNYKNKEYSSGHGSGYGYCN